MASEPKLGHIGGKISENRGEKYTGLQPGLKLRLAPNLSCHSVCFLNAFNQSWLLLCYFSYKCVCERERESLVHLIMSLKHFIPLI
jgi:hypothetical protein